MMNILLVVHLVVCLLLVVSILLQKTSSDSIANLAGNSSGVISAQGAANFLTKTTTVLATIFMLNAILMGNLSTRKSPQAIEIEKNIMEQKAQESKAKELPIAK